MEMGFWKKLKKPFFAIAPMLDVTDIAFREILALYGKPDVFWTEFVSVDGLVSRGKEKLIPLLKFTRRERPIVAQVFGAVPKHFTRAAHIISELGFDGIDINMGCPDKAVLKQGAGSALIKNPDLAKEIILATKEGAGKMPVSVKTRLGYSRDTLDEWLPELLSVCPAVVTLHARTMNEMSKVPARWERVKRAVEIRNDLKSDTLIIGNGDVTTRAEGMCFAKQTGADGVMIGRGALGNPSIFNARTKNISAKEKLGMLIEHAKLFEKYFGNSYIDRSRVTKNFDIMKKHIKAYVSGFDGAKELRVSLMGANSVKEMREILKTEKYI